MWEAANVFLDAPNVNRILYAGATLTVARTRPRCIRARFNFLVLMAIGEGAVRLPARES